jgi:hypothetical protein
MMKHHKIQLILSAMVMGPLCIFIYKIYTIVKFSPSIQLKLPRKPQTNYITQ